MEDTYNENLTYDKNGNIQTLKRYGSYESLTENVLIDDLVYSYNDDNKNLLEKVVDLSGSTQGFKDNDESETGDDYDYDEFGNMISDENKDIAEIIYNHLNLPIKISFESGDYIRYYYDANGVKLKKVVNAHNEDGKPTESATEYINGFQYNNNTLQFFPQAEGYVKYTEEDHHGFYNYVYQYKDHLGNIRLNYTLNEDELVILDEHNYYSFGLEHEYYNTATAAFKVTKGKGDGEKGIKVIQVPNSGYQYKYNGIEFQDELGLNMYAMDMRQYDPAIARWTSIDPVTHHSMSTYNAYDNNPVYWADPSGADAQGLREWAADLDRQFGGNAMVSGAFTDYGFNLDGGGGMSFEDAVQEGLTEDGITSFVFTSAGFFKTSFISEKELFEKLWGNYNVVEHLDPKTKEDIYDDHCAINVSEALSESGIKLNFGKDLTRCWNCPSGGTHAIRAHELATWLRRTKNKNIPKVKELTGENFENYIYDKTGIIFFANYWIREGQSARTGDHIDLWKNNRLASIGWFYTYIRINYPDISESHLSMSDFRKSSIILFWEIN